MKLAAACLSVLLLSACADAAPPAAPPPSPTITTTTPPAPSTTTAARKQSARGNLVKNVGERAGWTTRDQELAADFTLTAIEVDPRCKAQWENTGGKHMLVLSFTVETTAKLPADQAWWIMAHDFEVIGPDGFTESALVPDGYGNCPKDLLPTRPYAPASKFTGKLVLFSKHAHGTLVYRMASDVGWEWTY
ncbi:hypothetical protein M8C13_26600 [Crossiella sp. SN42]|uniref:hypothetical protein n=1 Tax=Crossiella sp. SN42 TaxID=2944808 RepID=UPI00207C2ECF|nr:hypothetical protein [Crossiella sp. SN42]MCO1579328.1 hypothetical protein [Crossiella sp. SN42]